MTTTFFQFPGTLVFGDKCFSLLSEEEKNVSLLNTEQGLKVTNIIMLFTFLVDSLALMGLL